MYNNSFKFKMYYKLPIIIINGFKLHIVCSIIILINEAIDSILSIKYSAISRMNHEIIMILLVFT